MGAPSVFRERSNPAMGPVVLLLWAIAAPIPAAADTPHNISRGERLRVTAPTFAIDRKTGTLLALSTDTLYLRVGEQRLRRDPLRPETAGAQDRTLRIPTSSISALDLSLRQESHAGDGFAFGALAGIGWAYLVTRDTEKKGIGYMLYKPLMYLKLPLVGGGVGAIIGSAVTIETWESIAVDQVESEVVGPSPYNGVLNYYHRAAA